MSKPKEFGKLVADLSVAELRRERDRCKMMVSLYGPKRPAGKGAQKRLHAIERRLAREGYDRAAR
jgi:hypothetical protein